jgi:ABC-type phosphate transport system ATPase subunit
LEEAKKMSTEALDARRMRAAKNQSLLREVNERIEELAAGQSSSMFEELRLARTIDLACECMDETCTERVTLTVADYEEIRSNSNSFFVLPGHEVPDVEEVTRNEENYRVVSKLGAGARVAEKLDPRTRKDKR